MKITKNTKISEVVQENPEAAMKLFESGMGCVGCPMAQMETIEQGCKAHGLDDKQIEELVNSLNAKEGEKEEKNGMDAETD